MVCRHVRRQRFRRYDASFSEAAEQVIRPATPITPPPYYYATPCPLRHAILRDAIERDTGYAAFAITFRQAAAITPRRYAEVSPGCMIDTLRLPLPPPAATPAATPR